YNKANPASPTGGGYITNSFNNILWNNATSLPLSNGSTLTATYSDFQATNYPGVGNLDADPLFLNPTAHDYRLAAGSPTIGAGLSGGNLGVSFPVGGIPGTPLLLSSRGSGTDPITLVWVDDADNENGFVIERSTDSVNWQSVAPAGANVPNYTDSNDVRDLRYYYRTIVMNDTG